jgi:hypothetical protein
MFHVFQMYVSGVLRCMLQVFYLDVVYVTTCFAYVTSVVRSRSRRSTIVVYMYGSITIIGSYIKVLVSK